MGQRQSCSSSVCHMAHRVLYPIFSGLCMHLLSHHISTRDGTMVDRTAGGVRDGETVCKEHRKYVSKAVQVVTY